MDARNARRWWALGALTLAVLAVGLDATVLSVALPTLATDLHASTADLQWFVSGYTLVLASALLREEGEQYVLTGPLRTAAATESATVATAASGAEPRSISRAISWDRSTAVSSSTSPGTEGREGSSPHMPSWPGAGSRCSPAIRSSCGCCDQ